MFILNWNEPYMPLLPSRRASPHFDRYSFFVPLRDWVGLSDCEWLVKAKFHYAIQLAISSLAGRRPACEPASELDGVMEFSIYKSRWFTRPKTVTHPSTNRARRRVTSLTETNALPLSQAGVYVLWTEQSTCPCLWVGTSLGTVLVITLTLSPDADVRRREPVIVSPSGQCSPQNGLLYS